MQIDQIIPALDQFIEMLKQSSIYKSYETQKERLSQNPELKQKVDAVRERNYLYNKRMDGNQLFEESDQLLRDVEELQRDSGVHEFMEAELAYCKMVQDIMEYLEQNLFADFE